MEKGFDELVLAGESSCNGDNHIPMSPDSLGKRKRNDEVNDKVETTSKRARSSSPLSTLDEAAEVASDDESEPDPDEDFDDPVEMLWSEEQEPLPSLPIYHPDIAIINKKLLSPFPRIQEILDVHDCSSNSIETIKAKISDIYGIPSTKPIRIGLLGGAGVGELYSSWARTCHSLANERQARAPPSTLC